jgi:hypothetical protein
MREPLAKLASSLMIAYLIYRGFTTLVIMPLVESFWSFDGLYFFGVLALAATGTWLSFTRHEIVSVFLALMVGCSGLSYWWVVMCRRATPIWSDFESFVVPEAIFFAAACF